MKPIMTFCKNAAKQLKNISKSYDNKPIFIGVKGGGCNGLKYYIEPLDEPIHQNDEQLEIDGVKVVVCKKSLLHILGTELTWKKDYMGERFDFINPNATGSCGCGETFST